MNSVNFKNPLNEFKHIEEFPWMRSIRKRSLSELKNKIFPTKKDEDWKYTNPSSLFSPDYFYPHSPSPLSKKQLDLLGMVKNSSDFLNLVFIDGHYSSEFSDPIKLNSFKTDGWFFISLKEIKNDLNLRPYHLDKKLSTLFGEFKNKGILESLNGCYFQDGGFFVFASQNWLSRTIHIIDIVTSDDLLVSPKYCFYALNGSKVSLAHTVLSRGDHSYFHNAIWDFHLEEKAHLKWLFHSNQNQNGRFAGTIRVKQKKNSQFSAWQITQGSKIEKINWNINLSNNGASCDLKGIYALREKRHSDSTLKIYHQAKNTKSHQLFKGIVSDHAHGIFNGLVHVDKVASGSESSQINRNILLDSQSRIDTRPQLIIKNDNVKCSHGATVGQIEGNELFYLQSRGISSEMAFDILTHAFLEEGLVGLDGNLKIFSKQILESYFTRISSFENN